MPRDLRFPKVPVPSGHEFRSVIFRPVIFKLDLDLLGSIADRRPEGR